MENKKRAFELNEEEHENLKNLVAAQGIIFEEEVEKNLEHIFGSDWSISSNVCFREKGMDEDFDGRFEIDFIVKPDLPYLKQKKVNRAVHFCDKHFLNPQFLIEAKTSKFDWCFFDLEVNGQIQKTPVSFFVETAEEEAFLAQKNMQALKVKRALTIQNNTKKGFLEKNKKFEMPNQNLIRQSVRQLIKNLHIYLKQEQEPQEKIVIPIIVTNAPLIVFSSLFDSDREINLKNCTEQPYVCFEFDDFLFFRGEKLLTEIYSPKNGYLSKELSTIHVWIVNEKYLHELIHKILPETIRKILIEGDE